MKVQGVRRYVAGRYNWWYQARCTMKGCGWGSAYYQAGLHGLAVKTARRHCREEHPVKFELVKERAEPVARKMAAGTVWVRPVPGSEELPGPWKFVGYTEDGFQ